MSYSSFILYFHSCTDLRKLGGVEGGKRIKALMIEPILVFIL